jgi:predicted dehydrogenase
MAERRIGIVMHGVTGRMGYNQHLVRSILAIREQGGLRLKNGDTLTVDPIIVGRDADKLKRIAERHGIVRWTTDLDAALANRVDEVFFDAGTTQMRAGLIGRAIDAGKHVYCEKPVSDDLRSAVALAK